MTLLDDLGALDLSGIVSAKGDIQVSFGSDELASLLDNGAVTSVLGDLGTVLEAVTHGLDDPATLLAPILAAFADLAENLVPDDLPVSEYADAVIAGARLVGGLVAQLSGDPRGLNAAGVSLGDVFEAASGMLGDQASAIGDELGRVRALVGSVERGLPSDPAALIGPALEIVLPFSTGPIDQLRTSLTAVNGQLDRMVLRTSLSDGLVAALGQLTVAARAGDRAGVEAALTLIASTRRAMLDQVGEGLRRTASLLNGLDVAGGLRTLVALRGDLASADDHVFALLDQWRELVVEFNAVLDELDPVVAMTHVGAFLDLAEAKATEFLFAAIDDSVSFIQDRLRGLLREIPLRPLRQELTDGIASVAAAINDADLDAPVDAVRSGLAEISRVISELDPAALVQQAVSELEELLAGALDSLEASLGTITGAINDVAGEAAEILGRAVEGLHDFREVVDQITAAIEDAGIQEAADAIAAELHDLQEQVSELLGSAPIPDALRGSVDQLVSLLESIDLDAAVGEPLREVAAQIAIPGDVAATVRDGLQALADAVVSLVPTDVIADLNGMVGDFLAEFQNLDLAPLTAGITDILDQAASTLEGIGSGELEALLAPAGEAFDQVLAVVDRLHPRVILAPVITAYGDLLGHVPVPDPTTMTTRAGSVLSAAGETAARAATEPVAQAVTGRSGTGTAPPAGADPAVQQPPADLRIGDVVRLIGFLPGKLREALRAMQAGQAGEVLGRIDHLFGGTAAELRAVRDRLVTIERAITADLTHVLAPLGAAQLDAQLALESSVVISAPGFDVEASLDVLAQAGPGQMQGALAGDLAMVAARCQAVNGSLTGAVAHDLDAVADLLDAFLPSGITGDLDAFLAALDPEPIAADIDALMARIVDAVPDFLAAVGDEIRDLEARIRRLVDQFNPGTLAQRYLKVLDLIREELSVLDPGRLADELGEIHGAVRSVIAAYDPRGLAAEIDGILRAAAADVRSLDPSNLLPDLSGLTAQVERVTDLLPVHALEGIGQELVEVGDELRALDITEMIEAVNALSPEMAEAITTLIDSIRDELVALLRSIRYAHPSASASASVSVG
jgi:hypothetical protein